jgi:hypothetical protein
MIEHAISRQLAGFLASFVNEVGEPVQFLPARIGDMIGVCSK